MPIEFSDPGGPPYDTQPWRGGSRLFMGVPADALAVALADATPVAYDAGEMIFDEGDPSDAIFLIRDGTVCISKRGRSGRHETLAHLDVDEIFGEMAFLDAAPRSARATAATAARLVRLDAAAFDRIMHLAPTQVTRNLVGELVRRLRRTDEHLITELVRAERLSTVGMVAGSLVHDLRNALNVTIGAADLLGEMSDDAQVHRVARMIRGSGEGMLEMARSLLEYSRGTPALRRTRVGAASLAAEVEQQAQADRTGVSLQVDVAYDGDIVVDRDALVRALLNLVRNALEATPAGGRVTLGFARDDDGATLVIDVADTGRGIPAELLPTIFEPFVTHGKQGGTGLGLANVRTIVEAHGGTIAVDSSPGSGTRFGVRLPVVPEAG